MNPNLSKALPYMAKYINETEDLWSQGNKKTVQYTGKNGKINDICYEFERNGACLRKGCKFIQMNRNAAYPSYSNRPKDRNPQNMPKNSGVIQGRARKAIQIKGMLTTSCSRTKFVLISVEQEGANMGDLADMFTQTQEILT